MSQTSTRLLARRGCTATEPEPSPRAVSPICLGTMTCFFLTAIFGGELSGMPHPKENPVAFASWRRVPAPVSWLGVMTIGAAEATRLAPCVPWHGTRLSGLKENAGAAIIRSRQELSGRAYLRTETRVACP